MKFGGGGEIISQISGLAVIDPPFTKHAAVVIPKRAAMYGIIIIQIAPVDNLLWPFIEN